MYSPVNLLTGLFLCQKINVKFMKTKDISWYEDKVESIRKRKKFVHRIEDPKMRKKLKS